MRHLEKILNMIKDNPVTVISGKTGCGKSTQVPKAIWKANPSAKVVICQPRRVAATSLAARVAVETKTRLGDKVGYHIGMEAVKSSSCAIIYMTYGILIQELLFGGELPYTHIVFDEIHERSLEMDFCFVALKNIFNKRTENGEKVARLIIMSATLNFKEFAGYFSNNKETGLLFINKIEKIEEPSNMASYSRFYNSQKGSRMYEASFSEQYRVTEMPASF